MAHEEGELCGYIEATSQDISQEVKIFKYYINIKYFFQTNNDPKRTSKIVAKWLNKDNKVKVLKLPSQSPDFNPI